MDLLNDNPVCFLKGDEFLPKEGQDFKSQVNDYFQQQGGTANSPFGIVVLDIKGIKNDISHGIGRLKSSSFAAIKDVLENGVVINPMKQYHTNGKKNPTGMIAAPIQIGDEKYVCVVEVIANTQIQRLYVHEVTLTKTLQKVVADTTAVHREDNPVTQPNGEIAKILHNYLISKQNSENNKENINCNRNMNKNRIRLTETQLHKVIKESVKKTLNEMEGNEMNVKEYEEYHTMGTKELFQALFDCDLEGIENYLSAFNTDARDIDPSILTRLEKISKVYEQLCNEMTSVRIQLARLHGNEIH